MIIHSINPHSEKPFPGFCEPCRSIHSITESRDISELASSPLAPWFRTMNTGLAIAFGLCLLLTACNVFLQLSDLLRRKSPTTSNESVIPRTHTCRQIYLWTCISKYRYSSLPWQLFGRRLEILLLSVSRGLSFFLKKRFRFDVEKFSLIKAPTENLPL